MQLNIAAETKLLWAMTLPQLKARYMEVFGEPTRSSHREYLIKRILWRVQANAEGDLSERARRRAMELASDSELRRTPPRMPEPEPGGHVVTAAFRPGRAPAGPTPGTVLTREYKGQRIAVTVRDRGFEYQGAVYRSLSAVANVITGGHWNGRSFFGLETRA